MTTITSSGYEKTKSTLIKLLNLGLPAVLIQLYFTISPSTFSKFLTAIRNEGWQGSVTKIGDSIQKMLKLYLDRDKYNYGYNFESFYGIDEKLLAYALVQTLQISRITEIIYLSAPPIKRMRLYRFEEGFPPPYADFINKLNQYNDFNSNDVIGVFNEYLTYVVNQGEIQYNVEKREDIPELIANRILDCLASDVADSIKPKFSLDTCLKLHKMFETTLNENECKVLCMFHGLGQPKVPLKDISRILGIPYARLLQLKDKALRRCRHSERMDKLFKPLQIEDDTYIDLPKSENLIHYISDLNMPKNIEYILTQLMKIECLEELNGLNRNDVFRYKGVGIRVLSRIECEMLKYNLFLKE